MKTSWIAAMLVFAGMSGSGTYAAAPSVPTADDFGDSVSLGYTGHARLKLQGIVDFRHDVWDDGDIPPVDKPYFYGQIMEDGDNDGTSFTLLARVTTHLTGKHFDVILFNSGIHDFQPFKGHVRVGLDAYRKNLEAVAKVVEQHADTVIWVDTTDVPLGMDMTPAQSKARVAIGKYVVPAHAQLPYNQAAQQIAKANGFYILNISSTGQIPQNVHFTAAGSRLQGEEVSACVLLALKHQQSDICHK